MTTTAVNVQEDIFTIHTPEIDEVLAFAEKHEGKNVLYFMPNGWSFEENEETPSDVLNHRMTTVFTTGGGRDVFIELSHAVKPLNRRPSTPLPKEMYLHVGSSFFTGDENQRQLLERTIYPVAYQRADITKWLNETFGTSFDTIHPLHPLYGYEKPSYGEHMKTIELNHALVVKRIQAQTYVKNLYKEKLQVKHLAMSVASMNDTMIQFHINGATDEKLSKADLPRYMTIKL